jgi:hypothetical protein
MNNENKPLRIVVEETKVEPKVAEDVQPTFWVGFSSFFAGSAASLGAPVEQAMSPQQPDEPHPGEVFTPLNGDAIETGAEPEPAPVQTEAITPVDDEEKFTDEKLKLLAIELEGKIRAELRAEIERAQKEREEQAAILLQQREALRVMEANGLRLEGQCERLRQEVQALGLENARNRDEARAREEAERAQLLREQQRIAEENERARIQNAREAAVRARELIDQANALMQQRAEAEQARLREEGKLGAENAARNAIVENREKVKRLANSSGI